VDAAKQVELLVARGAALREVGEGSGLDPELLGAEAGRLERDEPPGRRKRPGNRGAQS